MAVHQEGPGNGAPISPLGTRPPSRPTCATAARAGLGAAYDLGREAVAAHLSVLDLAEAHHAALRSVLESGGAPPADTTLQAAEDFLRESLSTFESVHRGYTEVQEVARLEHDHAQQLRSLADASVAINSSMTVQEILQLTADAARGILAADRATVAVTASSSRLPPLTATSPEQLGPGLPDPSRLSAQLMGRGKELGVIDVVDRAGRDVLPARPRDPRPAREPRLGRRHQCAALRARAHDRAHAAAQPAPGRAARGAGARGRRPLPPRRREHRARRRLLRPLQGPRRRLCGADRRRAGQGPRRGGRHRARPPHAARRRGVRALAQRRPDAAAPRAARAALRRPLHHRRLRAHAGRGRARAARAGLRRAPPAAHRPPPTAPSTASAGSARCWAPTSIRCWPTSRSSSRSATCSCSTPTA